MGTHSNEDELPKIVTEDDIRQQIANLLPPVKIQVTLVELAKRYAEANKERWQIEARIEALENAIINDKPLSTVDSLTNLWHERLNNRIAELKKQLEQSMLK